MHISMNELKAALRRCFESVGYFVGNYEDAANMILWLEKHGLAGLSELERALPYIEADSEKPHVSVVYEDSISATIDCHNRSALNSIAAAVDLAQAKALKSGISTITVHNCHNRKFVLKALTDCGRRGISVAAYWRNGSNSITEHTVAIGSGDRYPSYIESETDLVGEDADRRSLTILCSSRINLAASLQAPVDHATLVNFSPRAIEANKKRSIDRGIEINPDLWKRINQIGTGILVANSERSRADAGGK